MFKTRARRATRAPSYEVLPKAIWAETIVVLEDELTDCSEEESESEAGFTTWQNSIESALAHLLKLLRLRNIGCGNLQISRTFRCPDDRDRGYVDEAREVLVYCKFPSTMDKRISTLIHDRDGRKFIQQAPDKIEFVNDELWYAETQAAFVDLLQVLSRERVAMDVCTFFVHMQNNYRYIKEHLESLESLLRDRLEVDVFFGSKAIQKN